MKYDARLDRIEKRMPSPWKNVARRFFQRGTTFTTEDGKPITRAEIDAWANGGPDRTAMIRRII